MARKGNFGLNNAGAIGGAQPRFGARAAIYCASAVSVAAISCADAGPTEVFCTWPFFT